MTFLKDISRNRVSVPVTILLSLILTTLTYWFLSGVLPSAQPSNSVWNLFEGWKENRQWGVILNYLLVIVGGWGIFKINETFSLSHYRTYLPFLFYLLFQVTNPSLQFVSEGSFAALFGIPAIALLFAAYQQERAAEQAFWVGLFVSLTTLFWTKALLYLPLFLVGFWIMRSWRLKVFLGLLIGLACPFWLQFAFLFFRGDLPAFFKPFSELINYQLPQLSDIPISLQIHLATTLFIISLAGSYLLVTNFREKVRTQAYYSFLIGLSFFAAALCILDMTNISGHLTYLYISAAFLASNIFLKVQTKLISFLFLMIISAYFTAYAFNLWIN